MNKYLIALGIFLVAVGVAKLIISLIQKHRNSEVK